MSTYAAYGTAVKKGSTTIIQVSGVSGPELSADMLDTTAHDTTSAVRTFVAGLIDSGEIAFTLQFDPAAATHAALITDLMGRAAATYSVVFPGGGANDTATFSGLVSKFGPVSANVDGTLTAPATIKVSGVVTWT